MTTLDQVVASLVQGLTRARVQGDLESLRIAREYVEDSLLTALPVPRFRLPQVEIRLPIAIEDVEVSNRDPADPWDVLRSTFHEGLRRHLTDAGFTISASQQQALEKAIDKASRRLQGSGRKLEHQPVQVADELSSVALRTLRGFFPRTERSAVDADAPTGESSVRAAAEIEPLGEVFAQSVITELRERMEAAFRPRAELEVRARTSELREVQPEMLGEIRLTLIEDAYEWTVSRDDQGVRRQLVPE